jgi:hypothetical protein
MALAATHAEIRLAVLGMAVMRTILPLPGDRRAGLLIANNCRSRRDRCRAEATDFSQIPSEPILVAKQCDGHQSHKRYAGRERF